MKKKNNYDAITAYLLKYKSVQEKRMLLKPLNALYIPIHPNFSTITMTEPQNLPDTNEKSVIECEVYRLDYFDKEKNIAIYKFIGVE
jgi:hypothetical protein